MYSPIRCQFTYSGIGRLAGYIAMAVSVVFVILNHYLGLDMPAWILLPLTVVATLLSYMPAVTWYYNQFSYRHWPLGHRYQIEFKNIEFIAIAEKEIKIKARGMGQVLRLKLLNFSEADRAMIKKLFLELELMLKTLHVERAVKAPKLPVAEHMPLHELVH
jgi:hypothetical protein